MDLKAVNRFVSALAGAFRSFYIYNEDNKAFEEILQNLVKRFQETQETPQPIILTVTNRSLLFSGEPVGFPELTLTLASVLRNLGYRSIQFRAPLQGRNFFQFLHILTGKDSNESKNEKFLPFLDNGEDKPISLVAFIANSTLLRLSDDILAKRLAPLAVPRTQGGTGFIEKMTQANLQTLPDFCVWVITHLDAFENATKSFVQTLIECVQKGFLPWERFLKIFPMPVDVRTKFMAELSSEVRRRPRKSTTLGQGFIGQKIISANSRKQVDWATRLSCFSSDEVKMHMEFQSSGATISASKDLDLAEALIKQTGSNFIFGLSLLLRSLSDKNSVAVQEKALRLATAVWNESLTSVENPAAMGLLSSLRQHLSSLPNIILALFPLRTATVESSQFNDGVRYFLSLGKYCLAPLLSALDGEKDRGMRKKMCLLIASVARVDGTDVLINALPTAPEFLKRNIVMILGELRAPQAVPAVVSLLTNPQKMLRTEAVRALCRINNDDALRALLTVAKTSVDPDLKEVAIQVLTPTKYKDMLKAS